MLRVTNEYLKDLELCGRLMEEEKNDPLLQEGEKNMAICVECEYKHIDFPCCKNPDLPIDDFVYGKKDCFHLNPQGNCKGFKAKAEKDPLEVNIKLLRQQNREWEKLTKNPGT